MKDPNYGSAKRQRRHFTGRQKSSIVKQHLVNGIAVSDLCDMHQVLPTHFYQWQKQLFEGGAAAFERKTSGKSTELRSTDLRRASVSVTSQLE